MDVNYGSGPKQVAEGPQMKMLLLNILNLEKKTTIKTLRH